MDNHAPALDATELTTTPISARKRQPQPGSRYLRNHGRPSPSACPGRKTLSGPQTLESSIDHQPARQRRQRSQRPRPARVPTSSGRGKNADGRREWPICTRDLPCGVLRPGQNQRPGECCMRRPRARATGRCARDHTACSTCTVAWRVRHRRGRAVRPCKGVGLVGGWVAGEMRRPVRSV